MILVTRLNGETFYLNAMYIEQIQSYPDTTITLFNSKKLIVKESETEVVQLMRDYFQQIGFKGWQKEVGELDEQKKD